MNLDRVTITGADDSISPAELLPLSRDFPWTEWGILVSAKHSAGGGKRFPSYEWISALMAQPARPRLNLSLHVCGRWVRELLVGKNSIPEWMLAPFHRAQLNFHAEVSECDPPKFLEALRSLGKRQIIFQLDGVIGEQFLEAADLEDVEESCGDTDLDCVPLFDVSGGAGVLPAKWPAPWFPGGDNPLTAHGYAGGLSPDNLAEQLPRIAAAAGDCRIWIDVETKVRSGHDTLFDLTKVRRFLEAAAPFVGKESP